MALGTTAFALSKELNPPDSGGRSKMPLGFGLLTGVRILQLPPLVPPVDFYVLLDSGLSDVRR
jgi:hypothetical protein